MALECFASKPVARRAPGFVVGLLGLLAVGAVVWRSAGVAAGCAGLAVLLLLVWPVHFEAARARIARILRPKVVWAVLLGAGLIASRVLATSVLSSFDVQPPPRELDLADVPVYETEALTDKGRAINQMEKGWEKTLTGIPKEIYQLWSDYLQPRGYRIRYQIVDFPGGVPGDIAITISWES